VINLFKVGDRLECVKDYCGFEEIGRGDKDYENSWGNVEQHFRLALDKREEAIYKRLRKVKREERFQKGDIVECINKGKKGGGWRESYEFIITKIDRNVIGGGSICWGGYC